MTIPIDFESDNLPNDRDFIFKSKYSRVCIYLVDINFRVIYIRNDTDRFLKINQKNRLRKLIKIEKK